MRQGEAAAFFSGVVSPAQRTILERNSASVLDLRACLLNILDQVRRLPNDLSWPDSFEPISRHEEFRGRISALWPGLGLYDAETGAGFSDEVPTLVGDALDDLADIAGDFENALRWAQEDAAGAFSWLRFCADTHRGAHVEELAPHLRWLSTSGEA